jgi:hypothetical protein
LQRQIGLEERAEKIEANIGFEERQLQAAEQNRDRQARLVAEGQGVYQKALTDSLAEVQQREQKISAFKSLLIQVRSEIRALQPTPAQMRVRTRNQDRLAALAEQRVKLGASIDKQLCELRKVLEERAQLTSVMLNLASEIDFAVQGDFDSARFDVLAASLPDGTQQQSKQWLEWFLGKDGDRRPCEIRERIQIFPETLAAAHCYRSGETVLLAEEQCAEVERERPHPLTPSEFLAQCEGPKQMIGPEPKDMPGSGLVRGFIR